MLRGRVTPDRDAVIALDLRGPGGEAVGVEAAIDTGFNGFLTLPMNLIDELNLPFLGTGQAALGDGHEVEMDLYLAAVDWTEGFRDVFVLAAEGGMLVGMLLLEGCRVILDVEEDGEVSIESLERIRSRN